MADARGPVRAPPLNGIVYVASATFSTPMVLILAAGWVLTVLPRSVRPARGRTLGSFCVDFVGAVVILGSGAIMVWTPVVPAALLLSPVGPRVVVPHTLRGVAHPARTATRDAGIDAGAIRTT